jgi:hypothetical protein
VLSATFRKFQICGEICCLACHIIFGQPFSSFHHTFCVQFTLADFVVVYPDENNIASSLFSLIQRPSILTTNNFFFSSLSTTTLHLLLCRRLSFVVGDDYSMSFLCRSVSFEFVPLSNIQVFALFFLSFFLRTQMSLFMTILLTACLKCNSH